MALVDYSDSETDEKDMKGAEPDGVLKNNRLKRKRVDISPNNDAHAQEEQGKTGSLPPLPSNFHDLYTSSSRAAISDDPSLHDGRRRIAPHMEGNWATHIYLEWYPSDIEYETLSDILAAVKREPVPTRATIHSLLCNELEARLPLHISLSRSISLVTEQRQSFSDLLEKAIASSGVRPFWSALTTLSWVANYERTRWFLVVRLTKPTNNALNCLLSVSNDTVAAFGQPLLYAEPPKPTHILCNGTRGPNDRGDRVGRRKGLSLDRPVASLAEPIDFSSCFHVSIAWTLGEPPLEMVERTESVNHTKPLAEAVSKLRATICSVKLKVGNAVKDIPLPTKAQEGKGVIGI